MHFPINKAIVMGEYSFLSSILSSSGKTGPSRGDCARDGAEQNVTKKAEPNSEAKKNFFIVT